MTKRTSPAFPGLAAVAIVGVIAIGVPHPGAVRAEEPGNGALPSAGALPSLDQDNSGASSTTGKTSSDDTLQRIVIDQAGGSIRDYGGVFKQETPEQELKRYFDLYKNAMDNKEYGEATTLAKRVVELSIAKFGIDDLESARALTNLGTAQTGNEQYEPAILNYNAAIDIVERARNRLDENLVNPLKGLAAAQLASGQPGPAVDTYNRAVHVTHVNEGPHNTDQVAILESLAEAYLSVGEPKRVERISEIIFDLEARGIDLDSMAILPVLEKQAYWQHRLYSFEKERYTWRKIIGIIEDHRDDNDLSLIPPLTGLGKSYLYVGNTDTPFRPSASINTGEVYLKRAVRIAEDNPQTTWQLKEQTKLALGDFYILAGQPGRAEDVYEDVWTLLSADDARLRDRHDSLQTPVILQGINPPKYINMDEEATRRLPGDDFETGTLAYNYSVTSSGHTTDVTLVKAEPDVFEDMQHAVRRELRLLTYRPKLVEGETTSTEGLTYTHKFFYRQSDLDDAKAEMAAEAAD